MEILRILTRRLIVLGLNDTSTLVDLLQGEQSNTDMSKQDLLHDESVGEKEWQLCI